MFTVLMYPWSYDLILLHLEVVFGIWNVSRGAALNASPLPLVAVALAATSRSCCRSYFTKASGKEAVWEIGQRKKGMISANLSSSLVSVVHGKLIVYDTNYFVMYRESFLPVICIKMQLLTWCNNLAFSGFRSSNAERLKWFCMKNRSLTSELISVGDNMDAMFLKLNLDSN